MTLKQMGQHPMAIEVLDQVREENETSADPLLAARVLAELGDLQQMEGRLDLAMAAFQEALSLLPEHEVSLAKADLKLYVGGIQKTLGSLAEATDSFRAAQRDYQALGMRPLAAYTHLVVAETLLEMKRDREAEWEILAALPTIDEIKMVPEGFAAVALLHESVRRRSTDTTVLQQLKAHLQSNS
jgi:tetratricopeptide (TPR) repeat protein